MPKRRRGPHRREWLAAVALHIARHPGQRRKELATHFGVAARQMTAYLSALRQEDAPEVCARVTLELVRDGGYRYAVVSMEDVWTTSTHPIDDVAG